MANDTYVEEELTAFSGEQSDVFDICTDRPYPSKVWREAIHKSLSKLNTYCYENNIVLDLGGGSGPFFHYIDPRSHIYITLDKSESVLTADHNPHLKLCSTVLQLPLRQESIGLIVSTTTLQYFYHNEYFKECHRVLSVGGVVAVHENGAYNPPILIARLLWRILGVFKRDAWEYRNSIKRYIRPTYCPEGFIKIYSYSDCLFTPILFVVETIGFQSSEKMFKTFRSIDKTIIDIFPFVRHMLFMHTMHFRKI